MKTVIIDNYDSFTYNLVHYIEEILGERPTVLRNDAFELRELNSFDCIVLSPGPGLPLEAGLLMQVIEQFHTSKIILGVCLGHQAIGQFFGGKLENLASVFHGVATPIQILGDETLYGKNNSLEAGRYHSWVVAKDGFPTILEVTSIDEVGSVMSFKHKELPLHGIQYHPESVLTPQGKEILSNFFKFYNSSWQD